MKRNLISLIYSYKNQILKLVNVIQPNHIIVADNGIKAFLIPLFFSNKSNLILEIHSSLYIKERENTNLFFALIRRKLKVILASKFTKTIFETTENQIEWNSKNSIVIPNPLWFLAVKKSNLQNKKVIAVARHTYEKGLDRLLKVWSEVIKSHPDWCLDIYGNSENGIDLQKLAIELEISKSCTFFKPSKQIDVKYLESSIFALTSRFEAFGMVLIEAMEAGLPCIAYDCPCGPRTIIQNNLNGFLVENDNEPQYVSKLNLLIANENLRLEMGKNAARSVHKYDLELIMKQWIVIFES